MSSPTEELAGASLAELGARLVLRGESETPHRAEKEDALSTRAQTCVPTSQAPVRDCKQLHSLPGAERNVRAAFC